MPYIFNQHSKFTYTLSHVSYSSSTSYYLRALSKLLIISLHLAILSHKKLTVYISESWGSNKIMCVKHRAIVLDFTTIITTIISFIELYINIFYKIDMKLYLEYKRKFIAASITKWFLLFHKEAKVNRHL